MVTALQIVAAHVASLLAIGVLAGAAVRRRWPRSVLFCLLMVSVPPSQIGPAWWPERFFNWSVWLGAESAHALLTLGSAAEMTKHMFLGVPRALVTARTVLLLVLTASLLVVVTALGSAGPKLEELALALTPRLWIGALVAYLGVLLCAAYYYFPVDEWHEAIIIGFVVYLLLYAVSYQALGTFGWGLREGVGDATQGGFILTLGYWCYAAWRRDPPTPADLLPLLRRTQPWRFS